MCNIHIACTEKVNLLAAGEQNGDLVGEVTAVHALAKDVSRYCQADSCHTTDHTANNGTCREQTWLCSFVCWFPG